MKSFDNYNPCITDQQSDNQDKTISQAGDYTTTEDTSGATQSHRSTSTRKSVSKGSRGPKTQKRIKTGQTTSIPEWMTAKFWRDLGSNQTLRNVVGLALGCFTLYLAISFVSYLRNCMIDQSAIASAAVGSLPNIANSGGEAGARLSNFFIDDTFGVGAIVLIFWMLAMCLKLFGVPLHYKTVNFTIKCFVALIAISLIVGLTTIGFDSVINWGGAHGRYVNEFIIGFVGWPGAVALCIFVLGVFTMLCLSDLIRWIMKLRHEAAEKRRIAREEREAEEERLRLIKEMEEQEKADQMAAGLSPDAETQDLMQPADSNALTFSNEDTQAGITDAHAEYVLEDDEPDQLDTANLETKEDDNSSGEDEPVSDNEPSEEIKQDEIEDIMVVKTGRIVEGNGQVPAGVGSEVMKYKFPDTELLIDRDKVVEVDPQEQLENKERIRKTLMDFGIPIVSIEATVGPTVTLYEIVPEKGVKIAKIRGLVDDIALRLAANGVRIIAPIPGKGTVGIEVANKDPQTVSMRTVIRSQAYQSTRYKLPIAMGATISNQVYIADLAKMPHLLVAGATGQGKSVGLNAIINSLLFCRRPDELKFVLIDPKMVEFSLYAQIEDHYLAKMPGEAEAIITDISRVAPTLSSLCVEMDDRYQLLKKAGARNIEEYNAKYAKNVLLPTEGHRFLPYIVIIVDEFSDLIMQSGKEVEIPIARLAQKARAVGMHVILATQRPSTDVITGLIKSNFPARIAFKTSQAVDSKTILDTTGAQQLIGRGDMLISFNSEMTRVQCAFIDTPEVEAICSYINRQPYGQGAYILPEPIVSSSDTSADNDFGGERDPLFEEIARTVVNSNTASTSSLQRRYSIGYTRAGRIMDQLEQFGIVGPSHGGKPRAVLVDAIGLEDILTSI